jgi:hypothetical protein
MATMVEVDRASRYDEPKQSTPAKPEQPRSEPTPTPESARNALQQSMERRW